MHFQTAKFEGDQRTNYRFATTHTEAAATARSLPLGPPPPRRTRTSKDKAADDDEEADVNAGGGGSFAIIFLSTTNDDALRVTD